MTLAELATADDARLRIETVVAMKTAWVDQRVVDDLRRAIREIKRFDLPIIDCAR